MSDDIRPPAVCIGKFDALHRGHRALVEAARPLGRPTLLRFAGMAEALGWPARLPLVAEADRPSLMAAWEASEVSLPFDRIRACAPEAFLAVLDATMAPRAVVVGSDFRGGPGRAWGAEDFAAAARQRGWSAVVVNLVDAGGDPISSSRIRTLLAAGAVAEAADLLGRPHRLRGPVVRGDGRGRQLGIPTANLAVEPVVRPALGVYAAWAQLEGQRWPSVVNLGVVPTAGDGRAPTCEAHLLGFTGDLYGRVVALDMVERLREERRFPSFDDLVAQIHRDAAQAAVVLAQRGR